MTKILAYVGIAVLLVIAVVLGYKIYQQLQIVPSSNNQPVSNQQSNTPQSSTDTPTTNVSEDRKKIASYPGPSAPDAQRREFQDIIDRNAQVSDTLDITKCETTPMVLKVKKGSNIKLINNDPTVNAIIFGPGKQYEVAAKSSTTMTVDIDLGVNLYRCTGISGIPIVGAFVVTE